MASPRDNGGGAGVVPALLYPQALLSLPDLDRPPALLTTLELEAVAAALPAKKRRLRETFHRLAAASPRPLPFRWEDLDAYISSLQFPATLTSRQLRGGLHHKPPPAPAPASASAENAKKRKVATADEPVAEIVVKISDVGAEAAKKASSSSQDMDGKASSLGGGNGLAESQAITADPVGEIAAVRQELPAAKRRAFTAANLVKVSATNNATGPQRRRCRPRRHVAAPATASAPAIASGDAQNGEKLKVPRNDAAGGKMQMPPVGDEEMREFQDDSASPSSQMTPCQPAGGIDNVPASAVDGTVCDTVTGVGQGTSSTATPPHAMDDGDLVPVPALPASLTAPKVEPLDEAADVEMEVVEAVEAAEQTPEVVEEDVTMTAVANDQEASNNKVSLPPLGVGDGGGEEPAPVRHAPDLAQGCIVPSALQQHHMATPEHPEPISRAHKKQKKNILFSRNHGDRPTGSQHVLEAHPHDYAQRLCSKHQPGRGSTCTWRENDSRSNGYYDGGKGKFHVNKPRERPKKPFCKRCGSVGHLAHKCETPNHLVRLYQKDKEERETNQICYRCGRWGHWSRICKTPQHLVDFYQQDRRARLASFDMWNY
ncbi:hypothetical protein ACP4OV_008750 [Aristida adscensionis]